MFFVTKQGSSWMTPSQQEQLNRIDFEVYNENKIYEKWEQVSYNDKYYIIDRDGFTGIFDTNNATEVKWLTDLEKQYIEQQTTQILTDETWTPLLDENNLLLT
jgi:uncharacterized phage-like protein YoqJ